MKRTAAPGAAARAAAARVLAAVRFDGRSLKQALPAERDRLLDPRDRALVETLASHGCRGWLRFEAVLERLLERPLPARARPVQALLVVGLTQLDTLQMPAYAAIAATAEAARLLDAPHMVGLVNALLRRFQRESEALAAALADDPRWRTGHPRWLLERLEAAWPDAWPAIVAADNEEAPLWLRVNLRHGDRDSYRQRLQAAGLDAIAWPTLPAALRLAHSLPVGALPGFDAGDVSVQDGAAQAATLALDCRPGERVLDACAAPGGKTAALLEAEPSLQVVALDQDVGRLARIGDTLRRLGLAASALLPADAGAPADWWDGRPFDRILLDAPCSATGVLRRQPDIRLHRREGDIARLVATQRRLLDALWPLLRPGGRLVYATCSLLPDENAAQVDAFLARHADARPVALGPEYGRTAGAGRQRLPGDDGMDGFFCAALDKTG